MKSKFTFLLLIILFICSLPGNTIFAQTISAASTPSTCTNNGSITLTGTNLPTPILYGIAKSPYNEPDIISSSSPSFTGLQPGDYFYGYFSAGIFIKSASTVNVANNYNTTSPTFSNYYPIFYAYCGTTDPLGAIYATVTGGNKPYTVELIDSNNDSVQQLQTTSSISFTGINAGNYTLRATDACGTIVLTPSTMILKPNVPYTDFTLATVSQQPSTSYFNVIYSNPGDVCSSIVSATVTNLSYILGFGITDVTTATGTNVPQYYGAKIPVYKIEVQNASGGFDVFDNLTAADAYSKVFLLPTDRSKWGLIKGSVTLCGITKTNVFDLAQYKEFKQTPLSFVSINIYDDPTPLPCVPPTQVQFTTNLYQSGGCQPITLDITEKGTSNTQHYELPFNFSFKIDIGKTYVLVIKDATGQVLPSYNFRNGTTSTSSRPTQTDPNNLYIDPAFFTPLAIKDKISFTDGPSSKNIGKSALVINNVTTSLGLTAPVRIQSISGPSTINQTLNPTSSSYYVGLGNNLTPGAYKIRVTDSKCFSADYDIVLSSYFVSVALQNVTSEPSPVTCDRYIKKGQIRVTAVGKPLGGNPDIIRTVYGYDSVYPRLLGIPTGATVFTTNSSNFTLTGDATIPFTFTADLSGNYVLALSRQNDNRVVLPAEIFENTTTLPLEVLPNFPAFDLNQSGGIICPGNTTGSLIVKVNNTIGAVTYFIKKDTDTDFPGTGQTSTTFTGLTAGNYVIKAKTSCYEVIQAFTLKPAADVGPIIVGDNAYCTGATLNLSTIALGPVSSIVWTLPNNSTVSTPILTISNVTTANNGLYKVHVVTSAGCVFDGSTTLTVNPNGEVALPVFNITSPPLICQSSAQQLTDYTANATNATNITYSISPSQAGTIGTGGQPATVEWNPAFNGTATITATATGCGTAKSTDFVVIVSPRSSAADILTDDRTICPDQTGIILTALAPTITNPFFTWYDSNLASATILGTENNLVVSPTITTTYYVGVEGDDLCLNDVGNRKEVTITVNPVATVGDIIVADQSICEGETASIPATSLLINPIFKWYTDPALTNLISNIATLNVTPQTTTTYYVTVEADGVCTIPPPAKAVTVTVNPLPIAAISYPNSFYCTNGTATVTQTGVAGGNYSGDTGLVINATTGEINLASSTIGNHTITYIFSEGTCSSSTTASITINSNVILVGTTSTACASDGSGYVVTLTVSGEAPYTATGTGAPGTWSGATWTSGVIPAGTNYNVNIQDTYACNSLVVSDVAPICCLFDVVCPTFPITTITCYNQLPTATTLSEAEFEALGNGNGTIGDIPCGVIEITASNEVDPGCSGDVMRTYTVTEYADPNNNKVHDPGENTVLNTLTCTQTITINRVDFTMPTNEGSTVACASFIIPPTVPVVTDNCGNVLTPSAPIITPVPACNGDVTYTYTFTDCEGNTHDWIYTYTINRVDFTMPTNEGSTVACASSIIAPTVPVVTDNCGNVLTPSAPIITPVPACNGEVTYTYTFTDCEGNTHDWVYTYTINRVDFTMPTNEASTVACASSIIAPTVPVVTDNCGNVLTPSAPIITPVPACNGDVTYTYTFTDCEGNTHDWIYTYTINRVDFTMPVNQGSTVACASSIIAPTVPVVTDNCGNVLTPSAPIITPVPACNGDVTYTYTFTDCEGNTHDWIYTYTINRVDFTMPVNQGSTVACASSIIAPTVPAVTDNCGNVLTPSAPIITPVPACNGDVTYTYTFTDCEGNTHDWIYTYTINRVDFTMPVNQGSTVACASSIIAPTVPVVTDNCGNVLTPSAPIITPVPACNGDVTYTYTFTDCEGNTHDWVYTYTINRVDFTMPTNEGSTVACASSIIAPTVPVVTDNCGNVLTPSAPIITPVPACNGDVTYTYTFTDCEGHTHNWTYTYTIDGLDFIMPVDGASTVACAASIVAPTVPVVIDNCGNILTPSAPVISATPICNGTETYTYTYTDCKANTHDWVYTYTIYNTIAPTGTAPANLSFQCIEDVPPANINDVTNASSNCNGILNISVSDTNNGGSGCTQNPYMVTRTYTLTDCGGLSTNLVQIITVADTTAPIFNEVLPPNTTVECSAAVPPAVTLTATDNCSAATVTYNEVRVNGTCAGNYQLQRTWTATDACGNKTAYTQLVTIADTTAPVFTGPLPTVIVDATCATIPAAATLTATDTCGTTTVNYTETKIDGSCSSKYALLRTWIASDDCGNQTTYTQTINVSCLAEIYNAISPNGDGMNDTFKIEGIDCFPNNTVEIFNRYGAPVYKKDNYDNVTNPFEGYSDGRATVKRGEKLPTGTYFYILTYDNNGNRVEKSGYLYIGN